MKKILLLLLLLPILIFSQNVPVTLHFKPPYTTFSKLRLVGNFNNWNNSDDNYLMTDDDGDGIYEITVEFAKNTDYMYKFVMDADWGQAWNDPDNPEYNKSDNNNSILKVRDPMITYLLPRDVNSEGEMYVDVSKDGEPIIAVINHSSSQEIDTSKITLQIDGVKVQGAGKYYDPATSKIVYYPPTPLSEGEHSINLVIITKQGGFANKKSTFKREKGFVQELIPVDFYFDINNRRNTFAQVVNSTSVVGDFNNWNDKINPMEQLDEGLWRGTVMMKEGRYTYKIKVNGQFWLNDFDSPEFDPLKDNNNVIYAVPDSIPYILGISPMEGKILKDSSKLNISAILRPGVRGNGVNESSISVKLNGSDIPFTFDTTNSNLNSELNFTIEGPQELIISFENNKGYSTSKTYTYGYYPNFNGYVFEDARNDEQYLYPSSNENGSADIETFKLTLDSSKDSLQFNIKMKDIQDRTRLVLQVNTPNNDELISNNLNLELLTENWIGKGFLAVIAPPNNSYANTEIENKIRISNDPVSYSKSIKVNTDALSTDEFVFKIALSDLDSLMGQWRKGRDFTLFSYLADTDGSGLAYEVSGAEKGSSSTLEPDVYDAAFFRSSFWQGKVLTNYIPSSQPFGEQMTAFDGFGRGIGTIEPAEVSDDLANFEPEVTILNPEVEYWYDTLTVAASISDKSISKGIFTFNGTDYELDAVDGIISMKVTLNEGENSLSAKATNSKNLTGFSKVAKLIYKKDYTPSVTIDGSISGNKVTLTAVATSPKNLSLTYNWKEREENPVHVNFNPSSESINFTIPNVNGEYSFKVTATDSEGRKAVAGRYIIVDENGIRLNTPEEHASWIDKAVFYEIYPRSFSEKANFEGIKEKVNYLVDLGVNAVWLMPIYKGPTLHGYEITDYYNFEEDYGNVDDFRALVEEFHKNGIKVILDFVVNHTGITHPFMQNVFQYKEYSPYKNFYIWDGKPGESNYSFLFDWSSLPNLNHNNPDVRKYFIDVAKYWVQEYDIDGFRCDVAWGVEQRNNQFWKEWRAALKNLKPEVFLEAEASSSESVFYDQRFDSANDWDLRNKLLGVLKNENDINTLDSELRKAYSDYQKPFRFVENHDEDRVVQNFDTQRSKLVHTIIMTANGVPLIYSGGEVGESSRRGMIDWSDNDNIRPYFKKLVEIRKTYLNNPKVMRLFNNKMSDVYSYASFNDSTYLVTVANFSDQSLTVNLFMDKLPITAGQTKYLTDLINGDTLEVTTANLKTRSVALDAYEARVFLYSKKPVTVGVNEEDQIVKEYKLEQNYPNPFNPSTRISFSIPQKNKVTLEVYNILGEKIATLINGKEMNNGNHSVYWNATNSFGNKLSSGVYFYRIKAGDFTMTRKMLLLK